MISQIYKFPAKTNTICKLLSTDLKGDLITLQSNKQPGKPEVIVERVPPVESSVDDQLPSVRKMSAGSYQTNALDRPSISISDYKTNKVKVKSNQMARNPYAYARNARRPMYLNPAGPGDHNVPNYSAIQTMPDSTKRSTPCFSIVTRNSKMPYFPEFATDFKGKESPGIGVYYPNEASTKEKQPEAFMTCLDRFQVNRSELDKQIV